MSGSEGSADEPSGPRSAHEEKGDGGSEERGYLTVNVRLGKSIVTADRDNNA